jgi:hypothetical protein
MILKVAKMIMIMIVIMIIIIKIINISGTSEGAVIDGGAHLAEKNKAIRSLNHNDK